MDSFKKCFSDMFRETLAPDLGMLFEYSDFVDRYIGEGSEAFYYSLRSNQTLEKSQINQLIKDETLLAIKRSRRNFEWKTFEIFNQDPFHSILQNQGYALDRTSRLLYKQSCENLDIKTEIDCREVKTSKEFEDLLDANQAAFGRPRSLWLNDGLRHEIKKSPCLVKAYVCYINDRPISSGWVKNFNGIGYFFGGGTIPEFRGRGAYKALVKKRSSFVHQAGIKYVISECSPDSELVLRSLNFKDAGNVYSWLYTKNKTPEERVLENKV